MRAALYLRASTEHQRYSTSNQDEALRQYADREGLVIVASYEDDGRSGLTLSGRPGLRQLLQDVLSPGCEFKAVLVLDVSRWGRFQDADESAYYEFMCRRAGVRVVYCGEPHIDDDNPMAAIFKSLKRVMAAEYSRELSAKVLAGQRRLTREGFSQGAIPGLGLRRLVVDANRQPKQLLAHGERKTLHTDRVILVPGPSRERVLVRRIFTLCADQRLGPIRIAKLLNKEGVQSPRGDLWVSTFVRGLLKNEKYVGTNVYGRTAGPLRSPRRRTPQDTWVRCEGAFEPIVSQALFDRAQAVLARSKPLSHEAMLAPLAALYQREGFLSAKLIDAQSDMPSSLAYGHRFGGLIAAFGKVGYIPEIVPAARRKRAPKYDPDELRKCLRACLARHGTLSKSVIESDPDMPAVRVFYYTFGGLRQAYAQIGFEQSRRGRLRRAPTSGSSR
ncbi:MAG: recombinase family protein [Caulobacteraceae bacterium]